MTDLCYTEKQAANYVNKIRITQCYTQTTNELMSSICNKVKFTCD